MTFVRSKTGIAVVLLIVVFAFLYIFTPAFGGTKFNLTLLTNRSLNNGLVAHYTFDARDVNGFTVTDRAGSNDGSIVATSSPGSEVLVDATGNTDGTYFEAPGSQVVWTSDQVGYLFYTDVGSPATISVSSTTNAGSTWSAGMNIHVASYAPTKVAVWYDKWTPEVTTGRYIHLTLIDETIDELFYMRYDTSDDTYSDLIYPANGSSALYSNYNAIAITEARDGTLFMTAPDVGGNVMLMCSADCIATSSWSIMSDAYGGDNSSDVPVLLPIVNTDNVALVFDGDTNNIYLNVYSATSSSWWGERVLQYPVEEVSFVAEQFSATYNPNTGKMYVLYADDVNDFLTADHDISGFTIDPVTFATTSMTDVLTNAAGGVEEVKIVVDSNREGHLYALYEYRSTLGDADTQNLYYKFSNDDGVTWSAQIGPLNGTEDELDGLGTSQIADERISAFYSYDSVPNAFDVYSVNIADIGDYTDEKTVLGKIGQGVEFDGVDDRINLGAPTIVENQAEISIAFWAKSSNGLFDDEAFTRATVDNNNVVLRLYALANSNIAWSVFNTSNSESQVQIGDLDEDRWYHFVGTYDGTARLYIDGVLEGTGSTIGGNTDTGGSTEYWVLGAESGSAGFLDGSMDDFRVYNRALSASEISRLYDLGATTKINKTLNTNPELENGLVAHYTFDARDVSGYTVTDRAGINDGSIIATTSPASVSTLHNNLDPDEDRQYTSASQLVWTTDQIGYAVFTDQSSDFSIASTTDAGATWSTFEVLDTNATKGVVWYDRWTPENKTGTKIHIAIFSSGADEMYYIEYDTSNDTYSAEIQTTNGELGNAIDSAGIALTQAKDGTLYMSMADNTGNVTVSCSSNCTSASSWVTMSDPYVDANTHVPVLIPHVGTDNVVLIYDEPSSDAIDMNVYSATSSSWWGKVDLIPFSPSNSNVDRFNATYNPKTGTIYIIYTNDDDDYVTADHDIHVVRMDSQTLATTSLTNVATDISGVGGVKLVVDTNREGHLYAIYQRLSTITDDSTENVYYKISTDDGVTWSGEMGPVNATEEGMDGLAANLIADERITVFWHATSTEDALFRTVEDIGDYTDEKTTLGRIGQGMSFDGVDDYITIGNVGGNQGTFSAWVKPNFSYNAGCTFGKDVFGMGTKDGHALNIVYNACTGNKQWEAQFRGNYGTNLTASSHVYASDSELQQWQHLVMTWDYTSGVTLYINGEIDGSTSGTSNSWTYVDSFNIGTDSTTSGFWEGKMDDVRVYDTVLSTSTIQRLFDLGNTTKINTSINTNPDLENGLVTHYTFDGGSANNVFTDRGSLGNDSYMGEDAGLFMATTTTFGKIGQAISLDGENVTYIDGDTTDALDSLTTCVWIKLNAYTNADGDSQMFPIDKTRWYLRFIESSERMAFYFVTNGSYPQAVSQTTLDLNEWYHVCGVHYAIGTSADLYINGVLDESSDAGGSGSAMSDAGDPLRIGGSIGSGYQYNFNGDVDDVRVYNRTLSAGEILKLYQLGQ